MATETWRWTGQYQPWMYKDPADVLDYPFDWTDYLAEVSDTIASRTVTVNRATLDSSVLSGALVTPWLSGGTAGDTASFACKIVTAGGRTAERTAYLVIKQR